jgi:hypothetical protein
VLCVVCVCVCVCVCAEGPFITTVAFRPVLSLVSSDLASRTALLAR